MKNIGFKNPNADLTQMGLKNATAHWNLSVAELTELTLSKKMGTLTQNGTLTVDTGEFTGRSPKDRYIVKDDLTKDTVDWNDINQPISPDHFDQLYDKMLGFCQGKELYVRDCYACSNTQYRLKIRVINEHPWQNIFAYNMFIRPEKSDIEKFEPEWTILATPSFRSNGEADGTRQHNYSIINFTKKTIIIGGSAYTGEIKKGIFSVLNYLLPMEKNILSMHCSANVGKKEDTAIFFGLSGTGKTTLSADAERRLIGDDEHGWAVGNVFNFEGGCYAKTINLSKEHEPQIFNAIKFGAMLENIRFHEGTREIDFASTEVTQNTRVSYPIYHLDNFVHSQVGGEPKNIFFLTCDAFGVLPPVSKLTPAQAMYHFISGYTAKIAGTEAGITEPLATFSACFGAPFLPLHPTKYAELLGEKIKNSEVDVWLVNTGWTSGPYGVGHRINLPDTRVIIKAALDDVLDNVAYITDPVFGLKMPGKCPGVRSKFLNPINTWEDEGAYYEKALMLAQKFNDNFKKFEDQASDEILAAAPNLSV